MGSGDSKESRGGPSPAGTATTTNSNRGVAAGTSAPSQQHQRQNSAAAKPAPVQQQQQQQTASAGTTPAPAKGGPTAPTATRTDSSMFQYRAPNNNNNNTMDGGFAQAAGQLHDASNGPKAPWDRRSSGAPQAHPELTQLPPAYATLPATPPAAVVHGVAEPLRLTPEAIKMTAFGWTKPPIGSGGFSSVYEGQFYNQRVAVKVLTIRNPGEQEMFAQELRVMLNRAVWHRNVLPLLGFCDAAPAFIFPLLSPLSKDRLPRLPPDVRDAVCMDVARGLAHMHSAGFVHSDMKPDNVLIEFDQHRVIQRALVGDLGCVKSCAIAVAPFGTILYLDPNIPGGVPRYPHPGDDVYALGITFLAIFTACIPETREHIAALSAQLEQRDPFRGGMVRHMMHPDVNQRPTCVQLYRMLAQNQHETWAQQQSQSQSGSPRTPYGQAPPSSHNSSVSGPPSSSTHGGSSSAALGPRQESTVGKV